MYRFNAIPIKLSIVFFRELEQIISHYVWKYTPIQNKTFKIWGKKNIDNSKFFDVGKGKDKVSCNILRERYSLKKQGCEGE